MDKWVLDKTDVKRRMILVSRELKDFASKSFGPLGRATVVQANAMCGDALTITSISERYFQQIKLFRYPFSSLLQEVLDGKLAEIPSPALTRGLQLVLEWSLAYLNDPTCPVRVMINWSVTSSLHAIIRSIISTKHMSRATTECINDTVIPMILEAFLNIVGYVTEYPTESLPIRFLHISSHTPTSESRVWKHSMFMEIKWPWSSDKQLRAPLTNVVVALFNITIEPTTQSGSSLTVVQPLTSKVTLATFRQIGDSLTKLGVRAVMSQKIIPTYLKHYLASNGIFTIDRLALNHIRAVQLLSGATLLGDWKVDHLDQTCLGYLSLITTYTFGGKHYIQLCRDPQDDTHAISAERCAPVTTIALAVTDRFVLEELAFVMETALKRLITLMDDPVALAGAGCTEIHLAAFLRRKLELLRLPLDAREKESGQERMKRDERSLRHLRQAIGTFADCIESVAGLIAQSADDYGNATEELQQANANTLNLDQNLSPVIAEHHTLYGWDCDCNKTTPVVSYSRYKVDDDPHEIETEILDARVLDSFQTKRDALVFAVEIVTCLHSVASVVSVP